MAQHDNCHDAQVAISRIDAHEDICELRYQQINETMERMEKSTGAAHTTLFQAVDRINGNILKALIWSTLLFGGAVVSLVVYIYLHPKGVTP